PARPRPPPPPHLRQERGEIDKAEPHAVVGLGVDEAEPALLGELPPELGAHALRHVHETAHCLRRALVLEELPGGAAEKLLLVAEAEVHEPSLSGDRARARR